MKKIIFNEDSLVDEEIDKIVNKVRAFVINQETNEILLVHYAGLYMLPGGKIDNGEDNLEALKREISEESGIEIECKKAIPYLEIKSYDKNYFDRKSGTINRLTKTTFYIIRTNSKIETSKKRLTESEKAKNHSISFVTLEEMKYLIENNKTTNSKKKQFDREILIALSEFIAFAKENNIDNNLTKKQLKK